MGGWSVTQWNKASWGQLAAEKGEKQHMISYCGVTYKLNIDESEAGNQLPILGQYTQMKVECRQQT